MSNIHSTAIIDSNAELGENLTIGPYSVIGPNVKLGNNVVIKSHVVIEGNTTIGDGCTIFPFAAIGFDPQDKKFSGENSKIIIGNNNVIREYVTINPGTEGGGMVTSIGNDCLFMVGSHIAHDCKIGNNVIFANNATLAGHVEVGDNAILGGLSAVRQFVRIGTHAMIGGMAAIESDVIPYGIAMNERASLAGINLVGLKRRGFDRKTISAIRQAYEMIFEEQSDQLFADKINLAVEKFKEDPQVMEMLNFLLMDTSRAICKPKLI